MPNRTGPPATRPARWEARPPLDAAALDSLAIAYVGRFATSRRKLRDYLRRKLRERGWDGAGEPPLADVVERLVARGYVDDRGYALSKARSLLDRGYGAGRVSARLRGAGIGEEDGAAAIDLAGEQAADAALKFARRRRIGPWAPAPVDSSQRAKWLAAMIRAGHRLAIARPIVDAPPGAVLTADELTHDR